MSGGELTLMCCFVGEHGSAAGVSIWSVRDDDSMVGASLRHAVGCFRLVRGKLVWIAPIEAFVIQFPMAECV